MGATTDLMTVEPRVKAPKWRAVAFAVLAVFLLPALIAATIVVTNAREAEPFVESLKAEAERLGVEATAESTYDTSFMGDEAPPGAVEQNDFINRWVPVFHGEPFDGTVLYWPLLILGGIMLTFWTLGGLAVSSYLTDSAGAWAGIATITTLALLWLPMWYYRDVIEVVSYYVE